MNGNNFGKVTKKPPSLLEWDSLWHRAKIRKVKETSPSPFYDGKYHPPIFM